MVQDRAILTTADQ